MDAETAAYIAEQVPPHGPARAGLLTGMLDDVVIAAVAACRAANDASLDAAEARQVADRARAEGEVWANSLRERAFGLTLRTAELQIDAHEAVEKAEGVARAVDLARRGVAWAPRDHDAELDELLAMRRAG